MPETVHTISEYWDQPREGVADYHGKPHVYSCVFDQAADDWTDMFTLQPLDEESFRFAMEKWAIWLRWEKAFHNNETTQATHPALPHERAR